jgi:hypothetical protein
MRLFTRRRLPEAGAQYTGRSAAAMRGCAAEIPDAGAVPWEVLWEALKLDAAGATDDGLVGELGLHYGDWTDPAYDHVATRIYGARHGRQVEIRMGHTARGLNVGIVQTSWVRAAVPEFEITSDEGRLVADDPVVTGIVAGFAPSRAWEDTTLRGGPEGIAARRPIAARGQQAGWAYDLWLSERIADALGTPLPPTDLQGARSPYKLG